MNKAFYILLILCLGFKCNQDSFVLKNGIYKVKYDEEFSDYPKFEFLIKNNILTELKPIKNTEYHIEWFSEYQFRLNQIEKQTDSLTEFEKLLGNPYYELTKFKNDTIDFVFRLDLHGRINSGKIIRMK